MHSAFARRICFGVRQSTRSSSGLQTTIDLASRSRHRDVEAVQVVEELHRRAARRRRSTSPSSRSRPAPPGPGTCRRCRRATPAGRAAADPRDLRVVRRDDEHVGSSAACASSPSRSVHVRPTSVVDELRDDASLPRATTVRLPVVLDGDEAQAGAAEPVRADRLDALALEAGLGVQPAVVRDLGDERDRRRGASGTSCRGRGRDRSGMVASLAEQVLERRHLGAVGMRCPSTAARAAADRRAARCSSPRCCTATTSASDIWPASSTNSTSTESRMLVARPEPRACRRRRRHSSSLRLDVLRCRRSYSTRGGRRTAGRSFGLLDRAQRRRRLRRRDSQQLVEQVADHGVRVRGDPDRAVARRPSSSTIMCAPVYVLPEPGGPWIARHVASSCPTSRRAASSGASPGATSGAPGSDPALAAAGAAAGRGRRGTGPARRCRARRPSSPTSHERVAQHVVVESAPGGISVVRVRHVAASSTRLRSMMPTRVVDRDDRARRLAGRGVDRASSPTVNLWSCGSNV